METQNIAENLPSNHFNFCPECGGKNISVVDGIKWFCPECNFTLYNNVAAAVGLILHDDENNVLFEVRQKNPGKGMLSLVGGFIDYDETAEAAVVRECQEEIGYVLKAPVFLCTEPNAYPYKNILYKTCDVYFTENISQCDLNSGALSNRFSMENFIKSLKPQKGEVISLVYHKITSVQDIEKLPIAFESARLALKSFISKNKLFNSREKR